MLFIYILNRNIWYTGHGCS